MHHTVEDVGIALGQALREALGDKRGIVRYADVHLPMDETLTRVALDFSGRPFLVFRTQASRTRRSATSTPNSCASSSTALAMQAHLTLHVATLYGDNNHHVAESCFKGLARALRVAVAIDERQADRIPSTKGSLAG